MDIERGRKVLEILDQVIDMNEVDRVVYLETICADDAELKQEILKILNFQEN